MAARPRPRRRPGAALVTAAAALAGLVALAAVAVGRETPGGLRDDGPGRAVTPPAVAKPLWPQLATAPPPTAPSASTSQAPPQPVPDITVPGHDLTAVDVRTLLGKDPGLSREERLALGSCDGCEVRPPEFRDLTGDGRPELITAVTVIGSVVLHVYALDGERGEHVLPVLRVPVQNGFSAATVDSDLVIRETTSLTSQTTSRYHWDGVRLVAVEQRVDGVGLLPRDEPSAGAGVPTAVPTPGRPDVTTARPGRPSAGATAVPAPAPTSTPEAGR
ncbi:hypothetical protein [Kitasatospora sp. NPDC101183]|uniref:hypothetical protein n=1 Tax=Kitasatospora sp. NPDC101183 TaxID=3364100 RepID=UPI00382EA510